MIKAIGAGLVLGSLFACGGPIGTGEFSDAGLTPNVLDPGFGSKGTSFTPLPGCTGDAFGSALAKTSTGFVVAGAGCQGWAIARYTANGVLDPAFGDAGVVLLFQGDGDFASVTDLAVRPDGRIVVAGRRDSGGALRQLSATGVVDTAFSAATLVELSINFSFSFTMALQPDGNLVVAGGETVVRFKPDGALDPSFGTQGVATLSLFGINTLMNHVSVQDSGRIALVGMNTAGSKREPFVAMINAKGERQTGYGTNGLFNVPLPGGGESAVWAVASQPDGSMVLAGSDYSSASTDSFLALWRATPAGAIDTTFGTGGRISTAVVGDFSALAVLDDGAILAAGAARLGGSYKDSWAVARFTAAGKPDTAFGKGGIVLFDFEVAGQNGGAKAVLPTAEGAVVTGRAYHSDSTTGSFGLARVLP